MINVYLIRGIPGAGKTTLAHQIADVVFSADDYYMVNGEYKFDKSKIKAAHNDCFERFKHAVESGNAKHIAVANTFTQSWELERYELKAKKHKCRLFHIVVENRHGNSNIHNVPSDTIEAMRNRFEIKL